MPVVACSRNGRPGYRWGQRGRCFIGPTAQEKAAAQGRAIEAARRQRADATKRIILPPRGIERDYRRFLVKRVERLHKRIRKALRPVLRADGAEEDAATAEVAIRATERAWVVDFPPKGATEEALNVASQVDRFTTRRTVTAVERVVAIDPAAELPDADRILNEWARANVELIGSLDAKHIDDAAKAVAEAVRQGKSTREVGKVLEARLGITKRRAALIARDQIGTLNAQITQQRQTDLGIKKFRWSTSGDERVRPEHEAIDGQVFDWATGHATEGFPGQPISCRCTAAPVFE